MSELVERTEMLAPEPAMALAGLLDVPLPDLQAGEALPLTWHWLYLLERPLQRDLGPDGHPVRHAVSAPPGPGRRRMWAGGSVRSLAALHVGEPATRRTRVLSTVEKQGRSGRLAFVTVGHTIIQRDEIVVEERQELVYRDAATGSPSTGAGNQAGDRQPVDPGEWSVPVGPALLFRFSALTYNAHRIHYDRDYARTHEGYPGLVVHGPLQAMVMAEAARSRGVPIRPDATLRYRLVAPLFEDQGLVVAAHERAGGAQMTVRDDWGRRTAEAEVF